MKQFTIFLGVVIILLLNLMEVLNVDRGALFKEYVCCACGPSVHLDVPSIGYVYV